MQARRARRLTKIWLPCESHAWAHHVRLAREKVSRDAGSSWPGFKLAANL
jgi:hypothetical protein